MKNYSKSCNSCKHSTLGFNLYTCNITNERKQAFESCDSWSAKIAAAPKLLCAVCYEEKCKCCLTCEMSECVCDIFHYFTAP